MRVLIIHNYYTRRGGEDQVFEKEVELLRKNNIYVSTYIKYNHELKNIYDLAKKSVEIIWSKRSYNEISEIIKIEKPDIAHFHNIWYNISPSAYYACKKLGVSIVQTLHNFRLFCANGLLLRKSEICDICLTKFPYYGVYYGCYSNSRIKTIPISLTENIHRSFGTWKNKVDAYIALTEFSKNIFVNYGISKDKIFVKPNFLFDISPVKDNYKKNYYEYFLYIGRLSIEKGVMDLLLAYKMLQEKGELFPLKIIGDGPIFSDVRNFIKNNSLKNVELLGHFDENKVVEYLEKAFVVIIPSIWYEMFPLVVIEAFRCGKSVILPRIGSFINIVDDLKTGIFYEFRNVNDLMIKMLWAIKNADRIKKMGLDARKTYEERYTPDKNYEYIMSIYNKVINAN